VRVRVAGDGAEGGERGQDAWYANCTTRLIEVEEDLFWFTPYCGQIRLLGRTCVEKQESD